MDNSFDISKKFVQIDRRIKLVKNIRNMGILKSFIFNAKKQKGEWIIFCDQDDIWFKNKLSTLDRFIKDKSNYNLFLHNGIYIVDNNEEKMKGAFGKFIKNNQKVFSDNPNLKFLSLLISNKLIGCFSCIRKDFLKKYVIIIPFGQIFHDHWIALICSFYSRIYFIDKKLIKYRRHKKNNTLRNKLFKKIMVRFLLIISLLINHVNIISNKVFNYLGWILLH